MKSAQANGQSTNSGASPTSARKNNRLVQPSRPGAVDRGGEGGIRGSLPCVGDALAAGKHAVQLALVQQLWVPRLDGFQLDRNVLSRVHVSPKVDVPERAAADLLQQAVAGVTERCEGRAVVLQVQKKMHKPVKGDAGKDSDTAWD